MSRYTINLEITNLLDWIWILCVTLVEKVVSCYLALFAICIMVIILFTLLIRLLWGNTRVSMYRMRERRYLCCFFVLKGTNKADTLFHAKARVFYKHFIKHLIHYTFIISLHLCLPPLGAVRFIFLYSSTLLSGGFCSRPPVDV